MLESSNPLKSDSPFHTWTFLSEGQRYLGSDGVIGVSKRIERERDMDAPGKLVYIR